MSAPALHALPSPAPGPDLLAESTLRLGALLLRESLLRSKDGRLEVETAEPRPGRLAEVEEECQRRARTVHALYLHDPVARRLRERLGLDDLDLDLLYLAGASQREPALAHALATLRPPGVEAPLHIGLLASLAAHPQSSPTDVLAHLLRHAPLARWGLISHVSDAPLLARAVSVPDASLALLAGDRPPAALERRFLPRQAEPRTGSPEYRLARAALQRAQGAAEPRPAIALLGRAGSGRRRFAAELAAESGARLLELSLDLAGADPAALGRAVREAAREARLARAFLLLGDGERLAGEERARRLSVVARVLDDLGCREPLFLALSETVRLDALARDVVFIEVPTPDEAQRVAHLRSALSAAAPAPAPAGADTAARLYPLSPGSLEAAARAAARAAYARAGAPAVPTGEEICAAARAELDHRLSNLADPIRQRLTFDDVILEVETRDRLREIVATVRHAETVYGRWGFGERVASRGLAVLFAGPPGTGKTMAASLLATELGLELYRIDLSRLVSKYIGETESNLAQLFAEARASRAILLFDEADALFGKRTSIKSSVDRYANLEVNFLLQKMEAHEGISILTSNNEQAMDEAFRRRLQFRLRFEPPEEACRADLWRKLLGPRVALAADVRLDRLARFELAGGGIRNAALRAAFLAAEAERAITMDDLITSARRELEEMGRVTAG